MHAKQEKPQQAQEALKFFNWAYSKGDAFAEELDYVPSPPAVEQLIRQHWSAITGMAGERLTVE